MAFSVNNPKQKKRSTICEINITPFVDVLLVLLIIFMVAAPMMTSNINISLPKGSKSSSNENIIPISVSIKSDGSVFLQNNPISIKDLSYKLLDTTANNLETKIFVRADKSLGYGDVMDVVSLISEAGFNKVVLVTEIAK